MTMKVPMGDLESGVSLRSTTVCKELDLKLAVCNACRPGCVRYHLGKPKRVGIARDASMTPIISQPVDDDFMQGASLELGQDITYEYGRVAPGGWSVGEDEATLKTKMRALLRSFGAGDADGNASRLLEAFLTGNSGVEVFSDPALDRAVEAHENFVDFSDRTMNAPGHGSDAASGKVRIHQALKNAGWNIDKVRPITDLGILAFNKGSKVLGTGDFGNGLGPDDQW
jgi:hypothetical protein